MGRAVLLLVCVLALLAPSAGSGGRAASLDFTLRATRQPTQAQLERAVQIVTERAHLLDGGGIEVTARAGNEIVVHIASISSPEKAKTLLASRGALAFYDFETHVPSPPTRKPPKSRLVLRCGGGAPYCPGVSGAPGKRWFYYAAKGRPELTGADLVRGETRAASDPTTGLPVVLIQFRPRGQDAIARVTAAEAQRGKRLWIRAGRKHAQRYFQHFAIVVDNRIVTAPSIDFQQYPDGFSAVNGIQLTGLQGPTEAQELALLLKSGTLPVPFAVQR